MTDDTVTEGGGIPADARHAPDDPPPSAPRDPSVPLGRRTAPALRTQRPARISFECKKQQEAVLSESDLRTELNDVVQMEDADIVAMDETQHEHLRNFVEFGMKENPSAFSVELAEHQPFQLPFVIAVWKSQLQEALVNEKDQELKQKDQVILDKEEQIVELKASSDFVLNGSPPDGPATKRRRNVLQVGGVPIGVFTPTPGTDIAEPEGSLFRLGGGRVNIRQPSQLPQRYPGKVIVSNCLNCHELLGPTIVMHLINGGRNMEDSIQTWPCMTDGKVGLQTQTEALTLARTLHLQFLNQPTSTDAVLNCPWMEMALRRLYAILHVEQYQRRNPETSRSILWEGVSDLLEKRVAAVTADPTMTSVMSQQLAARSRLANNYKKLTSSGKQRKILPDKGRRQKRNAKKMKSEESDEE